MRTLVAVAALVLAVPAVAQNPASAPMTGPASDAASANRDAVAVADAAPAPTLAAADQATYDADMEAWRAEVRATDRANRYSAELAAKQERAYADAMRLWRIQVADCRRGITAACRAPTPRPGDFM